MAITLNGLMNLEPTVVSRDLTGYITYVYGQAKVGKTTLAKDMGALIIACEDGTRAMSGAYAQIVNSWADIRTIARLLKDKNLKEKYKALAIDTVDIAGSLCEKYICNQNDVDKITDIPYGGGWGLLKKEFEEVFRNIALEGYAILFISHDKTKEVTRQDGTKYDKIVPTVSATFNNILKNMSDIICYGYQEPGTEKRYMILRSDGSIDAGSRFPYMESRIEFGYEPLVKALNDAIDKEEQVSGPGAVTDKRIVREVEVNFDFDELVEEFNSLINGLYKDSDDEKFNEFWTPRITEITTKYLGQDHKVSDCNRNQAEQIYLIVSELKDMIEQNK